MAPALALERAGGWTSLFLAIVALVSGCREQPAGATAADGDGPVRSVRLVTADRASLPRTVTATGSLAAEDQVALNTKVAGRLVDLPVDLGSIVRQGDVVAALDQTDFRLRVDQAETALTQARARLGVPLDGSKDEVAAESTPLVRQAQAVLQQSRLQRERLSSLHGDGIVARSELDVAEADFRVAEARYQEALDEVRNRTAIVAERRTQVQIAQQQLEDATLRAPFDGAVRERHLSIGGYLEVGAPVVTIVRMHPLRLRLSVPEREATRVRVGQDVRVHAEGAGGETLGKVARVSPAVDESTRTLMVEAEVPNRDDVLRPGAFATADIVTDPAEPVVLVPASSVVTFAGVSKVLGVADGRVIEKRVRTGRRLGDRVEVLEGVSSGETIVAEPGNLSAGQRVAAES